MPAETLSSYLPLDRRAALALGVPLPDRAHGAALFADISGFTPLTEALVGALGARRGAEELTVYLNQVYTTLIGAVHRYGGSVIGFAGDAITCWFDDAPPGAAGRPFSAGALRATVAALAMQEAMAAFAALPLPQGGTVALAMKAAVAAGPVRRFLVGNPALQVLEALAGRTLDRMAAAEHHAQRGEVVVDSATHAALSAARGPLPVEWRPDLPTGDQFAVLHPVVSGEWLVASNEWSVTSDEWRDEESGVRNQESEHATRSTPNLIQHSTLNTQNSALTAEAVRPWLLPAVYARLMSGQGEFLAELRPAVALFLCFGGIDYDADSDAGARLDTYIRWVQGVAARYEGTLLELTIGDKGSYLYLPFGAPLAHDDDAARAAAVAWELRTPPPDLAFITPPKMGLTQGRMRTGPFGSPARRTYGVLGDAVNLAARLMQATPPGEVWTTPPIPASTGRAYTWEQLPPLRVKGKTALVDVYRLTGPAGRPGLPVLPHHAEDSPAPLVGRRAERATLAAALGALPRGEHRAVVLAAEPGLGKSRLVTDFLAQAAAAGVRVLVGAGDAVEQATVYYAWREIFQHIVGGNGAPADLAARRAATLALLAGDPLLTRQAPLLNALLRLDLPDNDLTAQMSGQARADSTRDLLVALLDATARAAPTALVLEDAHWLDSASWALLGAAWRRGVPLAVVISTRPLPAPLPLAYRQILEDPATTLLRLDALGPEETAALICARLGVRALPAPVADLIRMKAEGNPFFSEELAYALRDARLILIQDGECRVAPGAGDLAALDLPDTVQGVIISRIDRLAPSQQLTVKVASVIGRIFAVRTLGDIYPLPMPSEVLGSDLAVLEQLDLTPLEHPPPELSYLFKHILTQETAYNLLLFAQRRPLHQAVAEWYERTYVDRAPFYPLLIYHWERAARPDKTLGYLEPAAAQALHNGAYQEAAGFARRALELAATAGATDGQRATWERLLGEAYHGLSKPMPSLEHLGRSVALLGWPLPQGQAGLIQGLLREVGWGLVGRHVPWRPRLARAATLPAVLRTYELILHIYTLEGWPAWILYSMLRAISLADWAGDGPAIARGYAGLGTIGVVGMPALARPLARVWLRRATRLAAQAPDLETRARVAYCQGVYHYTYGQWPRSLASFVRAGRWAEQGGERRLLLDVFAFQSVCLNWMGHLGAASATTRQIRTLARELDNVDYQMLGVVFAVYYDSLRGAAPEIAEHAAAIERLRAGDPVLAPITILVMLAVQACAYYYLGRPDDAWSVLQAAMQAQIRMSSVPLWAIGAPMGIADAALGLWADPARPTHIPVAALVQYTRRATQILHQMARRYASMAPVAWNYIGRYEWLAGHPAAARAAGARTLRIAQALHTPYYWAAAHYELGRHATGPTRRRHLEAAAALFTRIGAGYLLAATNKLLDE